MPAENVTEASPGRLADDATAAGRLESIADRLGQPDTPVAEVEAPAVDAATRPAEEATGAATPLPDGETVDPATPSAEEGAPGPAGLAPDAAGTGAPDPGVFEPVVPDPAVVPGVPSAGASDPVVSAPALPDPAVVPGGPSAGVGAPDPVVVEPVVPDPEAAPSDPAVLVPVVPDPEVVPGPSVGSGAAAPGASAPGAGPAVPPAGEEAPESGVLEPAVPGTGTEAPAPDAATPPRGVEKPDPVVPGAPLPGAGTPEAGPVTEPGPTGTPAPAVDDPAAGATPDPSAGAEPDSPIPQAPPEKPAGSGVHEQPASMAAPAPKPDGWQVDPYQLRAFSDAVLRARSYLDAVQAKVDRMQGAELTPQLGTSPVGQQLAKKFDDRLNSENGLRAMLSEAMKRMDELVTSAEKVASSYEEHEETTRQGYREVKHG